MNASEITKPGLYWAVINELSLPISITDADPGNGRLYLSWPGMEDELLATALITSPALKRYEFIGPFPPPGEGPKFEGFRAALDALCEAYGVEIEPDDARLDVFDLKGPLQPPSIYMVDRTKPIKD